MKSFAEITPGGHQDKDSLLLCGGHKIIINTLLLYALNQPFYCHWAVKVLKLQIFSEALVRTNQLLYSPLLITYTHTVQQDIN